jgi:hypothetical protein
MGGSKPSAPQVVMPSPAAPIVFQSIVPEQSYGDLAAQMQRYQQQRGAIEKQRYSEVGTPGEIGARQRARDVKTEEAYLASLPGQKPPGSVGGMMEPPRGVSSTALSEARAQYADALTRVNEVPAPPKTEKPSWADEELWKGVMDQTKTIKTG